MIRSMVIGVGLLAIASGSAFWIEQGQLDETSPGTSAFLKTANGLGMFLYFMRMLYHWAPDGSGYLGPDDTFTYTPQKRKKLPHEEYEEELAREAELDRAALVPEASSEFHPDSIAL